MRKLLVLFALLASVPVLVFAQAQPPGPGPSGMPWPRPDFGAMRQTIQQQQALHKQFRAKVLAAITPAFFCAAPSCTSLFRAPRSLKLPVICK